MKPRVMEGSDLKFAKPKNQHIYSGKQGITAVENPKADSMYKYHSSFNSNADGGHHFDQKRQLQQTDLDLNYGDVYHANDLSIDIKNNEFFRPPATKSSQSFSANERIVSLGNEIAHSQPEFAAHDPNHNPTEIGSRNNLLSSPEGSDCKKKQSERVICVSTLNNSHLDDYIKNHPMQLNAQETFEKTFKVLDRTGTNHLNHFMKQKLTMMKNLEVKLGHKDPAALIKNLNIAAPVSGIKNDKYFRTSTKKRVNHSTSQNKKATGQFVGLPKLEEPVPKKKPERKMSGVEDLKVKRPINEFEFNHVFKILEFLDKDKDLKQSRKKIQEKMKDLGRESFNEASKKISQIEQINEEMFKNEYMIKGVLGKGSYGEVKLCVSHRTGEPFAVKIYPRKFLKDEIKRQNLRNEREILQSIDHENIIKLYKVVEGPRNIFLLTEYGGRSSLHETLTNSIKTTLSEDEARPLIWQLITAIKYLHAQGVVHRDVKLHNVLVNDDMKLKLIDFGFALRLAPKELIRVFCGTPSYMAPEIVARTPYDGKPADIWALAVCIYRMVVGTFPFRGEITSVN